jgi:hypothetical protein
MPIRRVRRMLGLLLDLQAKQRQQRKQDPAKRALTRQQVQVVVRQPMLRLRKRRQLRQVSFRPKTSQK